jgi:hypothetical protein
MAALLARHRAGRRTDWIGQIARADGDRTMILDRALARYTARGWQIDDRMEFSAIIAKEWGPGYALMPLLVVAVGLATVGLVDLSARCPSGPVSFKRRLLTVDQFGEIAVARIDSRGEQATRYAHRSATNRVLDEDGTPTSPSNASSGT